MEQGRCVIISAPSGAGKTTIVHRLLQQGLGLAFSVSATSRERRAHEVDGRDYFFITTDDFRARIAEGAFIEWEEVYPGRFYGTLRSEIQRIWSEGRSPIFDVDVVGGLNLKTVFGDMALALFIAPPSLQVLEQRLRARGTETEQTLAVRMGKAEQEMSFASRFDAVIVNDDLERACAEALDHVQRFLA
jgi:guanylate kinase